MFLSRLRITQWKARLISLYDTLHHPLKIFYKSGIIITILLHEKLSHHKLRLDRLSLKYPYITLEVNVIYLLRFHGYWIVSTSQIIHFFVYVSVIYCPGVIEFLIYGVNIVWSVYDRHCRLIHINSKGSIWIFIIMWFKFGFQSRSCSIQQI